MIVPLKCCGVVSALITKHLPERIQKILPKTQAPPEHMRYFMAHVAHHGSVWLLQGLPSGGSNHGVSLGNTDCHHTVCVPHGNRGQPLRKHMENRARPRIFRPEPVPAAEIVQHPALGRLGFGPVRYSIRNIRIRSQSRHRAGTTKRPLLWRDPVATDDLPIHTKGRHGEERPCLGVISYRDALCGGQVVKPQITGTNRVGINLH